VVVDTGDGVVIQGDRRQLERVMHNVIGNAIKYSPDGTPVHVSVGRHDQWAVIAVRDRGVGIPREELPHIFTPFYRASTARGIPGTGIGLSGSRMIVEQHGGQITVESAVGKGTTVVVRLPGP
jgi:signal transduction histidine kinase